MILFRVTYSIAFSKDTVISINTFYLLGIDSRLSSGCFYTYQRTTVQSIIIYPTCKIHISIIIIWIVIVIAGRCKFPVIIRKVLFIIVIYSFILYPQTIAIFSVDKKTIAIFKMQINWWVESLFCDLKFAAVIPVKNKHTRIYFYIISIVCVSTRVNIPCFWYVITELSTV